MIYRIEGLSWRIVEQDTFLPYKLILVVYTKDVVMSPDLQREKARGWVVLLYEQVEVL